MSNICVCDVCISVGTCMPERLQADVLEPPCVSVLYVHEEELPANTPLYAMLYSTLYHYISFHLSLPRL